MSLFSEGHVRRRAGVLLSGVAIAALLAACGSSGGSSAGGATNNTTGGGAGTTASSPATDNTGTASSAPAGSNSGSGATAAELAAAQASVAQWSQQMTNASIPTPTTLTKPVDLKGKTVYLVPLSDGIPVIHAQATGVKQALTAIGAKYKVCDGGAGGQPNPTSWGTCLKTALDQKADAVISFYIDYEADGTQFDALAKAGIPTIIGGVQQKGLTPKTGLIDFYDNSQQASADGVRMTTLALALGGANTNLLGLRLLDSTATTASSDAGIDGFKKACAACGVTTADFTTANSQAQLAATVSAALVKNPKINMISIPVDSYTPLVIQGIQQAGKTGKVQFVSGSGNLDTFQRIKAGKQIGTVSAPSQLNGWNFVNGLMQMKAGMQVERPTFSAARVFTKDNVDSIKLDPSETLTDDWYFGGQPYIASYMKAWGLS